MKKTAINKSYHHGDLRSALIDTGLRLLETKAGGDIGLREVARETGVSATAVYRHFPDKDALLTALAIEGFEKLADDQEAAAVRHKARDAAFRAIGQAYVHFALAHPALFRLMTSYMHLTGECDRNSVVGDNRAGRLLKENIAALMPADASARDREVAAIQSVALVHGLAQLVLAGQVPNDPALIDAAVDQFGGWKR
ncbi:TetR/AcrR family transcriptional regulator [Parasphingopyxis algicola]|uniref:TetR/AcrR family transcriptional regulator n=1 Tax=Parasphingopyxis algicola TaxID=2026624 RepID=UPI0015A159E7|nr:TetR/AcrR family transcriptional regulator [Parasphingopyxis algicola]QLC23971.1 TetR/AcrR family transcriptional regulator [Parasphingopyxis algicola]